MESDDKDENGTAAAAGEEAVAAVGTEDGDTGVTAASVTKLEDEAEGNVQIILEKVSDDENTESNEVTNKPGEVSIESGINSDVSVTNGDNPTERPDSVLVVGGNQADSSQLGRLLEAGLEEAVRRSSVEEEEVDKTELGSQTAVDDLESGSAKDGAVSLKRKLEDVECSPHKYDPHRRDKDRSGEQRSKDHKKSRDRDRDRDSERRHRDKDRSHHDRDRDRDRDRHRDREKDRERRREREKKSVASVGLQCSLGPAPVKTEPIEPRLMFPDLGAADSPSPSVRLCGFSLANPLQSLAGVRDYTFAHLMYLELYCNGGGKVLHAWQEDVDKLSEKEAGLFAEEFIKEAFSEVNCLAVYCAAIVHNAAKGLPDFLEYLGDEHPNLPVKHGVIGHPRELETTTMAVYRDKVRDHFCAGTFRYGHLDNLSLVGTASEEAGGFFPDILDMLDEIPILSQVRRFFSICSKTVSLKRPTNNFSQFRDCWDCVGTEACQA